MKYDTDKIREDLKEEDLGAFFVGGFGGAMSEYSSVDSASDSEVLDMARSRNMDLSDYEE